MMRKPVAPPKRTIAPPAAKPPPPLAPAEVKIFEEDEVEQGTEEWFQLRLGIPTSSNFGIIMAEGRDGEASKTRAELMRKLAGEIMTGKPAEGKLVTAAMQRGKEMEPLALDYYARTNFVDLRRVGFVRRTLPNGRFVGASPDAIIGNKKIVEIKTMAPHLMIERLERGAAMPSEHRAQVQGTMWIGDFEEADLLLYYEGMPVAPKFTVRRDETYIREVARAVERFEYETRMLVEKIRRMS